MTTVTLVRRIHARPAIVFEYAPELLDQPGQSPWSFLIGQGYQLLRVWPGRHRVTGRRPGDPRGRCGHGCGLRMLAEVPRLCKWGASPMQVGPSRVFLSNRGRRPREIAGKRKATAL